MASSYDIVVSGTKAQAVVIPPVNGKDGEPLGPAGNGSPGVAGTGVYSKTCVTQATPGETGNFGLNAPAAQGGNNGASAFTVTITCNSYSGDPLNIANLGGDGSDGNDGGAGGKGSDGGKAGTQPKPCKQFVTGGPGGRSGNGGAAGNGGDAGSAADINVIYGPGISGVPAGATGASGVPGKAGVAGLTGTPGAGGLNSDGTSADPGGTGGPGASGIPGTIGYAGSFNATPGTNVPDTYLQIATTSHFKTSS